MSMSESALRTSAVEVMLGTKRLLRTLKITAGQNPTIKPIDLWSRLESAMVQAATGSRNWPEFCTRLLSGLNHAGPTKAWSALVSSIGRGETVTDEGEVIYHHSCSLLEDENWQRFKRVVATQATYIIVEAQVRNEEAWASTRAWSDETEETQS